MPVPTKQDADMLEALVDTIGLEEVCNLLAAVCGSKAEHIRENWPDSKHLAGIWDEFGAHLSETADNVAAAHI